MLLALRSLWAKFVSTGKPVSGPSYAYSTQGFGVRSNGAAYFALRQLDHTAMEPSPSPPDGSNIYSSEPSMYLRVAFNAMPTQFSASDEEHVICSLVDFNPASIGNVSAIGITPAGALFAYGGDPNTYAVSKASTAPGFVVADGQYHDILVSFQPNAGYTSVSFDSQVVASATAASAHLRPYPTHTGEFVLFNGVTGLTRCDCTITLAGWSGGDGNVQWNMQLLGDGTVVGTQADPPEWTRKNLTLKSTYYDPRINGYPLLWGEVPDPTKPALIPVVATAWARLTKPATGWILVNPTGP